MALVPASTIQPATTAARSDLARSGLTRSNATIFKNNNTPQLVQWKLDRDFTVSTWRTNP
jgi:hypothetical protein